MTLKKTAAAGAIAIALCAGGGVALASSIDDGTKPQPAPAVVATAKTLDTKVASQFEAFRDSAATASKADFAATSTLAIVARSVADSPSDSLTHSVDLARAVRVPVADSSLAAWIAPTSGGVCSIITDPVDGAGIGCATLAQIKEGLGFTALGTAGNSRIVVITPVPDGGSAPTVEGTFGKRRLAVSGNASAAELPADGTITIGQAPALRLDVLQKSAAK